MKTLRDMRYDGPQDIRSLLRAENGNIFEVFVTIDGETKDYLIGRILVHPTRLILKARYTTFTFQITDVTHIDWNHFTIFVSTSEYIWRYDGEREVKVYRRDSEGDHLIQ